MAFELDEYSSNMLIFAKDDHWKYLRTVLAPSYSSKRMREVSISLNITFKIICSGTQVSLTF